MRRRQLHNMMNTKKRHEFLSITDLDASDQFNAFATTELVID